MLLPDITIGGTAAPARPTEVPRARTKSEPGGGGRPATSSIVFRPTRASLAELWSDAAQRPLRSAEGWRLYYALASRGECRLLQTLLEDHGFVQTRQRSFNLLWLNCPVKPALLLGLNRYQKVNHFPRTQELTRKDLLARTLAALGLFSEALRLFEELQASSRPPICSRAAPL